MTKHSGWRRVLGLGVLATVAYAIWRASEDRRAESGISWQPQPFPFPPEPRATENGGPGGTAGDRPSESAPGGE